MIYDCLALLASLYVFLTICLNTLFRLTMTFIRTVGSPMEFSHPFPSLLLHANNSLPVCCQIHIHLQNKKIA